MPESILHSRFADLYDTYVRITQDIPYFLHEARQANGAVLELMSGTGRVSIPLIEAGIHLTCLDYSPEMLAILRRKLIARGLNAETVLQDVRQLDLARQFNLVFISFHSFSEITAREDQQQALQRIRHHLAPQGRFICTLHNPVVRLKKVDGELRLWGSHPLLDRPGKLLLWGLETHDRQTSTVHGIQLFEEYDDQGMLLSKRLLETHFSMLTLDEFAALASAAGFRISSVFGDYAYAPFITEESPYMIIVCS